MQKIKIGHHAKFRDRDHFFLQVLFPFCVILRRIFHFRCVAHATFDSNLVHSADVCFLISYGMCRLLARTTKNPFEPP